MSSRLQEPWDEILGTRGQVRVLRTLERLREPMAVRELARRAGVHLRAAQIAVDRLVQAGVVELVGTGARQQVRLRPDHPLSPAVQSMFEAERARFETLVDQLKELVRETAGSAEAIWIHERAARGGPWLELGVLAHSSEVDMLVDTIRESIVPIMRRADAPLEVRGWTRPDLETSGSGHPAWPDDPVLLWGMLPRPFAPGAESKPSGRRTHQAIDEAHRERAEHLAKALRHRPELVNLAKEEITKRLKTARPQERRTLQEWQQVLDGMSIARLRRWLVDGGEQAVRLRQSMPRTFLEAVADRAAIAPSARRGTRGKS